VAGGGPGARTLVIGCGFIGSRVVTELAARDRPPIVLTRSHPPDEVLRAIPAGNLHLSDAADAAALGHALSGVDNIVYSAGGLLPSESEGDPELDALLTLGPLRTVLEVLRTRLGKRLTYISSGGTVYGDPDELPVKETAPLRPHGSYGQLHLACEQEIETCRREHGLHARVLRCSSVYGERQLPDRGQGVIPTFLHRIEQGRQIDLYGADETVRDYVYVGDVAGAVVALLDRDDGEAILNLGSGEGTSLTELLRLVERQAGRCAIVKNHPKRDFDVQRVILDITRLRNLLPFEPTPLELGIERTHAWLNAHTPEQV
jgi:UDP-glucose 4-epimerase